MDNNIENNSDNSDNKKTLLGSFDIKIMMILMILMKIKILTKMSILLLSNDDSSKILETLKEIICDFYYG